MIAAPFPLSSMAWIALWVAPAGLFGVVAAWKAGRKQPGDLDRAEMMALRMRTRLMVGVLSLPAFVIGFVLEEPARDAWNARYGTCAQMLPVEAARGLLGVEVIPSIYESDSNCRVRYGERFADRSLLDLGVATYTGSKSSAFEYEVDKLRGAPVILDLPWPRSYTIVRKTVDETVILLELRHGAALWISLFRDVEDSALWTLVEGLAEREQLTEPLIIGAQ